MSVEPGTLSFEDAEVSLPEGLSEPASAVQSVGDGTSINSDAMITAMLRSTEIPAEQLLEILEHNSLDDDEQTRYVLAFELMLRNAEQAKLPLQKHHVARALGYSITPTEPSKPTRVVNNILRKLFGQVDESGDAVPAELVRVIIANSKKPEHARTMKPPRKGPALEAWTLVEAVGRTVKVMGQTQEWARGLCRTAVKEERSRNITTTSQCQDTASAIAAMQDEADGDEARMQLDKSRFDMPDALFLGFRSLAIHDDASTAAVQTFHGASEAAAGGGGGGRGSGRGGDGARGSGCRRGARGGRNR